MAFERRTMLLLLAVGVLAAPAVVLRLTCAGRSCARPTPSAARVPFCSLDAETRGLIQAGYRDGRSPDVLAVSAGVDIRGGAGMKDLSPAWPSASPSSSTAVPMVFWGTGINQGAHVPTGTGLDAVAPTLAAVLGFHRPHPEVRSGRPVEGVAAGETPRLVVLVVWKGVGSRDLSAAPGRWPFLRSLLERGAGTLQGRVGFLPLDPTAVLTTIGTGGLPSEHGMTGTLVREGDRVVRAWSRDAPFSVIATLGDDLDHALRERPLIGLAATDPADRGAIGGEWYVEHDRDDVIIRPGPATRQAAAAEALLASGYGTDDVPDLLAVVMDDRVHRLDDALRRVVAAAVRASGGSVAVAVVGTGSLASTGKRSIGAEEILRDVERRVAPGAIEAAAVGGLFVNQQVLAARGLSEDAILLALGQLRARDGQPLIGDAFSSIAVSLARYC